MHTSLIQQFKHHLKQGELLLVACWAIILNCIVELLGRDNPLSLLHHIATDSLFFIYNCMIVMLTLTLALFFKRRRFVLTLISAIWLALGIANCIVLSYRITPLATIDLFIMQWDLDFINGYVTVPMIIAVMIIIVVACFVLIRVFQKNTAAVVHYKKAALSLSALLVITLSMYHGFLYTGVFEPRISNMQNSYDQFGFVSCFARSAIERGIDEPENYDQQTVENLLVSLDESDTESTATPNIVVVQLESFFDPSALVGVEFSQNPIPNFTALSDQNSSGALEVAVVGAGTANTEFEVLTGMSVDFFGTGEYPYETILRKKACPNVAYELAESGYQTFAIHNNTGTFYDRYLVYPNMGFDTFVSSEFMQNVTTTPNDWIKDKHLTGEIFKCLDSTDTQDFVFAVSVQGHGSFPEEQSDCDYLTVTQSPYDEGLENQLEYYANQLYEMDLFVGELMAEIEQYDEPTMLVLYGDHIPSLDLNPSDFVDQNNYQTSYVICANFDLPEQDEDLATYQLLAKAFEQIGMDGNVISQLHQQQSTSDDYLQSLELLQYDLLYGESYALDQSDIQPTDLQMGVEPITFTLQKTGSQWITVTSDQLTEYSQVYVNDKAVEAIERDDTSILITQDELEEGDQISIKQVSTDGVVLYESEAQIL